MAIPKFYLEKRKDRTKNIPLILKYSFHGMRLEYYTGIRVDKDHYKEEYWKRSDKPIKPTAPKAEVKNDLAEIIVGHIHAAENAAKAAGITLDVKYFRSYLDEKLKDKPVEEARPTLIQYFDRFIDEMRNGINQKTGHPLSSTNVEKYTAVKNMLIDFGKHRGRQVDFDDMDKKLYDELVHYMISEKKYAVNTYGRHIKFIKTVLHKATRDGINTNLKFQNAFVGVTEQTDNAYLTDEELDKLYNHDFSSNPRNERVRDVFLVGCYTGLRFSDYTNIRQENITGDRIRITTQKTKKPVIIPLHPRVKAILEKYNFELPPAISNQKFNDYLADVCEDADIKEPYSKSITRAGKVEIMTGPKCDFITSHSARRTFASNAFKRGVSPYLIMTITGHKSEAEFMKYLKVTAEERAEMFAQAAKW